MSYKKNLPWKMLIDPIKEEVKIRLFQNMTVLPIGIKDNIVQEGKVTECASKILEGYVSPFSATVIERLRAKGFMPVGRLNMDEFAMGSSTENSSFPND